MILKAKLSRFLAVTLLIILSIQDLRFDLSLPCANAASFECHVPFEDMAYKVRSISVDCVDGSVITQPASTADAIKWTKADGDRNRMNENLWLGEGDPKKNQDKLTRVSLKHDPENGAHLLNVVTVVPTEVSSPGPQDAIAAAAAGSSGVAQSSKIEYGSVLTYDKAGKIQSETQCFFGACMTLTEAYCDSVLRKNKDSKSFDDLIRKLNQCSAIAESFVQPGANPDDSPEERRASARKFETEMAETANKNMDTLRNSRAVTDADKGGADKPLNFTNLTTRTIGQNVLGILYFMVGCRQLKRANAPAPALAAAGAGSSQGTVPVGAPAVVPPPAGHRNGRK